jgi:hypothetical protein
VRGKSVVGAEISGPALHKSIRTGMCTIAVYGLIALHGGVHNLYATRSAPLGCTILNVVAAQAPRHSMMKLCSHRSYSTARQRYCALAKLYHCIIFSTCVRRVLQRRSWQSGMESPWQHYNPSRTLAVHRQLPTPRYAPLAPGPWAAADTRRVSRAVEGHPSATINFQMPYFVHLD